MKILLTDPVFDFIPLFRGYYRPNIGLLSIAAYLEANGMEVRVVEPFAEKLDWKRLLDTIKREKPLIVGISSLTHNAYYAMALVRFIKRIDKRIFTVVGGRHFSSMPRESLRLCPDIDYIVVGEGEGTFLELAKNLIAGKEKKDMHTVRGLAYLLDSVFVKTENRPMIDNLDSLPFPAYHLIRLDKTKIPIVGNDNLACTFSRGCNNSCTFCTEDLLWQGKCRSRSARDIADELALLISKYGRNNFNFNDTDFLYDREKNVQFLGELARRRMKMRFRFVTTVKSIIKNRDLLEEYRRFGLIGIMTGFESLSQENLNLWKKGISQEEIQLAAKYIVRAKIPVFEAIFIFGGQKDRLTMIKDMLLEGMRLNVNALWCTLLNIYPREVVSGGTDLGVKNRIIDYRRYDIRHAVMPTDYFSIKELELIQIIAYVLWWYNPFVFFKNMLNRESRRTHIFQIYYDFRATLRAFRLMINSVIYKNRGKEYRLEVEDIFQKHLILSGKSFRESATLKPWSFRYD